MDKPTTPGMPGTGQMGNTFEFVRNLWGSMGIPGMSAPGAKPPGMNLPGMVMPTLSVEEINQKIADLKAVEAWLTLNMNMLRGTIQTLEVQSATLTALQSMGQTLSAAVASSGTGAQPAAAAKPAPTAGGPRKKTPAPEPTGADNANAAALTAPFLNATAWWSMLQNQFNQAVTQAMAESRPEGEAPAAKPDGGAVPDASAQQQAAMPPATEGTPRRKSSKS